MYLAVGMCYKRKLKKNQTPGAVRLVQSVRILPQKFSGREAFRSYKFPLVCAGHVSKKEGRKKRVRMCVCEEVWCGFTGGSGIPSSWVGNGGLYAAIQAIDPRPEALDNLANAADLVEFRLQLVDFAQDGAEAGDFGVGHLDCITCAVVLHLGCGLGLLRELEGVWISIAFLDLSHLG
jgi:hypothetical protein